MQTKQSIEAQLKRLGVTLKGWGSSELHELQNILMSHEEIMGHAHGWYENGFATLVATHERLLLIDKKLLHLNIEDIRYDMMAEVDFNAHLLSASIRINTMNKTMRFASTQQKQLRALTVYVQRRVMELRQQMFSWQQFEQTPLGQQAPQVQMVPAGAGPAMQSTARLVPSNPYTKSAFTTSNRHQFLPKVPRRWRPE